MKTGKDLILDMAEHLLGLSKDLTYFAEHYLNEDEGKDEAPKDYEEILCEDDSPFPESVPTATTPEIKQEQIRELLSTKVTAEAKELVRSYGVTNLSQIDEKFYPEIMEKARKLTDAT